MNTAAVLVALAAPVSVVLAALVTGLLGRQRTRKGVTEQPTELALERMARRRLRDGWRGYHARQLDGGTKHLTHEEVLVLYPERAAA